jgi:hypothetical protein
MVSGLKVLCCCRFGFEVGAADCLLALEGLRMLQTHVMIDPKNKIEAIV